MLGVSTIRARANRRVFRWIVRRQPAMDAVRLGQRNLYIVPSVQGLKFFLVIAMIWLMGTNYENNLVLLLSFILMAVFVTGIFATHDNLNGLSLTVMDSTPVFAGEQVSIPIQVDNPSKRWRRRLHIGWQGGSGHWVDVPPLDSETLTLTLATSQRGWLDLPRLKIETQSPLGILRCWSWPRLFAQCLIYPAPAALPAEAVGNNQDQVSSSGKRGDDDFAGLEEWQPGIPAQRVAWKQFSAGRGMLHKTFESLVGSPTWLDWEHYSGRDTEQRLSALCARALDMQQQGRQYGLRMPAVMIPPATGDAHLTRVLSALATHNLTPPERP